MTVKAIRLQNFMAFEDTGWIELRPITLLFGKNSSGKSTIIRALRLLKQSLDQSRKGEPLAFAIEDGVDIGSFRDMVHQHDLEKIATFGFRCDFADSSDEQVSAQRDTGIDAVIRNINRERLESNYTEIPSDNAHSLLDFSISFAWDNQGQPEPKVVPAALYIETPWEILQDQGLKIIFSLDRELEIIEDEMRDEQDNIVEGKSWRWLDNWFPWSDFLNHQDEDAVANLDETLFEYALAILVDGFLPDLDSHSRLSLVNEYFGLTNFSVIKKLLSEFRNQIKTFLEQIAYVGPFRPEPARAYSLNQFEKRRWERQGWQAYIDFLSENIDQEQVTEIGRWLEHIVQYETIEVNCRYAGSMGLMSTVNVGKNSTNQKDSIIDVGFGVSQVLPVIVQSVLAKPGQLIIIEQPELHLHPRAQARLGDLFITMANRDIRFLLETHSEFLLLRFRRRIAENTAMMVNNSFLLGQNNLSTLFMGRTPGSSVSKIGQIKIDDQGEMVSAPEKFDDFDGFFSNDVHEIAKIVRAKRAIRSRRK